MMPHKALLLLFTFGAMIMCLEILSSNMLSPHFGGSIYIWGSIISSFMVYMALGYVWGDAIAKKTRNSRPLFFLLLLGSGWCLLLPLFHHGASQAVGSVISDARWGSLLAMWVLFFVPITTMAMVSPYMIELLALRGKPTWLTPGRILFVSTMGSCFGTLATAFYLVDLMKVSNILYLAGAICIATLLLAELLPAETDAGAVPVAADRPAA